MSVINPLRSVESTVTPQIRHRRKRKSSRLLYQKPRNLRTILLGESFGIKSRTFPRRQRLK
jgi:hypothetical protein